MIFIGEQIIAKLKESLSYPQVKVRQFYDTTKIVTPLVTLDEKPQDGKYFPNGQPRFIQNNFQIEVYCKQQSINNQNITKIKAAQMLLHEVDAIIQKEFGLTQKGETVIMPYISDPTIARGVIRYIGIIDTVTEIIYR